ncbi:phage tail domain-containing protein [Staphylococcus kloosii]|uniref:Holin n=1 Tax=Staphylococcus kloosii TaxID=29384 RepID=A0ABQ0XIZ0_9STAP|nr:phage tail domain-containing protein [Staphylococcus kloosii]AVQ36579.1 phage tail family protein [Staphylococcus kloosii]PNZ06354.1 phage tail protein [Staphylococcus kloosii]GEP81401.1 holin [Staphylococcus kloosii]SUM49672.1 phage tail family protein [Staphylococcus kloosii]
MAKTVKMFNDDFSKMLTDLPNLTFLDATEDGVEISANTVETKGRDGVRIGRPSFGPFKLKLRFFYRGADIQDYRLLKHKLRGILFRRDPFYIVHSDMPGIKYHVYCEENAIEDIGTKFGTFEVTFNVFKGFSESLTDTLDVGFLSDNWQFEGGLITDKAIAYVHKEKGFEIWNGSNDTIDPLNHKLIIRIKADAPRGLTLINHTTGESFTYYNALTSSKTLTLNGIHPIIGNKRVGFDTDYGWITLAEGMNNIEIKCDTTNDIYSEFQFNFVYR